MRTAISAALAFFAFTAAAPTSPQLGGNVLVVDDDGPAPFVSIQAAVNAAQEGDVVLVRPGNYTGFVALNKSLIVVGDLGAAIVVQGTVRVVDLAASKFVVLANLLVTGTNFVPIEQSAGLDLANNAGSVRVEACTLTGGNGVGRGVHARACDDVALVGCELRGGTSSGTQSVCDGLDVAEASIVTVYGCVIQGGAGTAISCTQQVGHDGADGGDVRNAFLFGANSTFEGGRGGDAERGFIFGCPMSGNGGDGIHAVNAAVHLFDSATVAGSGGQGIQGCGSCAYSGYVGAARSGGSFSDLVGSSRLLYLSTPATSGSTTTAALHGTPGDYVSLLVSETPAPSEFIPGWHGMLLVPRPRAGLGTRVLPAGTIPASGDINMPLALPTIAPGAPARTLFVQALFRDTQGNVFLSGARSLTVLP